MTVKSSNVHCVKCGQKVRQDCAHFTLSRLSVLWDAKRNILKQDRKLLMPSFHQVVRATNVSVVSNAHALEICSSLWTQYPQWTQNMVSYWEVRQLWCMVWWDSTMLGHNTNNYCESTIRLHKDIVLGRCRAYSIVTFVDFTCTIMEDYYCSRLRLFSQACIHKPRLVLESLVQKAADVVIHSFIHYGDLYSAPSRLLLRSAPDPCTAKKKSFETRVECVRKNPGEQ